jgi:hypothetical protein
MTEGEIVDRIIFLALFALFVYASYCCILRIAAACSLVKAVSVVGTRGYRWVRRPHGLFFFARHHFPNSLIVKMGLDDLGPGAVLVALVELFFFSIE